MYIARVKYSKIAIPEEKEFETLREAEAYCKYKEKHNPYVRWTETDVRRDYPTPAR